MKVFWYRFYHLCLRHGTKPNPLGKKIGIPSGIITYWKQGGYPNLKHIVLIADYFDCSIDYLLGRTDIPNINLKKAPEKKDNTFVQLSLI